MIPHNKNQALRIFVALLALLLSATASAGMMLDIDKELGLLRDGRPQVHIQNARYRFAVFTFDDPDGTGLGNAVARILSHDLLMNNKVSPDGTGLGNAMAHIPMNSKVSSIGVLRYVGNLSQPSGEKQLRYFDKVEPLIESQGVQVAIWGAIRRSGDGIRIDSFTQLSPSIMGSAFSFSFRMPREMGGGRLVHRIGPDRMLTQRLQLSAEQAKDLARVAGELDRLRTAPKDNAPFAGDLPLGSVYYLLQRQGEWVQVGMQSGRRGWLRSTGLCTGTCQPLLSVARFASELMAYDDRSQMPTRGGALAPDTQAFLDQLWAIQILNGTPAHIGEQKALEVLRPWCPTKEEARSEESVSPPGGAATCNLRAITKLIGMGKRLAERKSDETLDPKKQVRLAADDLAIVSMSDPRHVSTLENLATLFDLLGDTERSELARTLAKEAASDRNIPANQNMRPPDPDSQISSPLSTKK